MAHYSDTFSAFDDVWFVTLTLDPKIGLDESDSRKFIIDAWSKWRKRIDRRCAKSGGKFQFVRVVEFQRSGMAHIHAVVSAPGLDQEELAAQWFECGGGVVCDVERLDGDASSVARRVGYAVKYALKDAKSPGAPRGRHYVESSQGIGYNSQAAKAVRLSYVMEHLNNRDEEEAGDELAPDEVLVWTAVNGGGAAPPDDPDRITAEDRARFAALDLDKRSRTFRVKEDGQWWQVEQHADGTRTRSRLPGYKSLYEQRAEAEEKQAEQPDYTAALTQRRSR